MVYLTLVSFIWAFSFSLIKTYLSGLDPAWISLIRLLIACLAFLPFLRLRKIPARQALRLMVAGAMQFGLMYLAYNASFQFLKAYEVALFTAFTPIYVTLIYDILERRFHRFTLLTALLATLGTIIVRWNQAPQVTLVGFSLVQLSNIGFALGLVYYRHVMSKIPDVKDHHVFGLLYLGAVLACLPFTLAGMADGINLAIGPTSALVLLYLGAVASGLSFFLWNYGSRLVSVGAMAIFNDLKVPLAMTVSLVFFSEQTNWVTLLAGGLLVVGSLWLHEFIMKKKTPLSQN